MRFHLIAVGKLGAGPERALFEHFAERLSSPLSVKEVDEKRSLPSAALKKSEGQKLLAAIPARAVTVALDEKGKAIASRAFAQRLGVWRDEGVRDIAFLIGGADGLDQAVLKAASMTLSFGSMTWPHKLVRGLLAEQLYRAQSILSGHPYHRE